MPEEYAICAGTVVPMISPPIDDGAVIVDDGKIKKVCRKSELPKNIKIIDHPSGILLPAFVNAHAHLVLTKFRGLADDADLFTWLSKHIMPLGIDKREAECRRSASQGVKESFRHGITTTGEQHYLTWGLDAMLEHGMKGVFFYEVFGLGTLFLSASIKRHRKIIRNLIEKSQPQNRIGVAPHAPYTVTSPMAKMAMELAEKHNLPVSTHIAESAEEVEFFKKGTGRFGIVRRFVRYPKPGRNCSPVEYFDELGILTPRTLVVHGVHLTDEDLQVLKARGCSLVTCPTSNAKLGVGVAGVSTWNEMGFNICIGIDSPASGESYDLFEEMRRMVLMQRGITSRTDNFTAEEVLRMVTVNPAEALGMEEMVGDMRENSCADFILAKPETDISYVTRDIYSRLLWEIKSSDIAVVWADGKTVYVR